jgi:hypothetical protein
MDDAGELTDDGLEHAASLLKILQIARFGMSRHFIQPAHGGWFETGLGGAIGGVDHLDFHLHRILTAHAAGRVV